MTASPYLIPVACGGLLDLALNNDGYYLLVYCLNCCSVSSVVYKASIIIYGN